MHGLMNRAVQCFVRDTYGPRVWADVAVRADLGFDNFEAMLAYDDQITFRVLDTICDMRGTPRRRSLNRVEPATISRTSTIVQRVQSFSAAIATGQNCP